MKNILLLFITLLTLSTVTYASFPITENGTTTELVADDANNVLPIANVEFNFGGFILGFASIISFTLDGGADTSLLALFMLTVDGVVLLLLLSARIGLPLPLARTASAFGSYMWILFKAQILLIRRTSLHRWEQVTAVRERLAHLDTIQR